MGEVIWGMGVLQGSKSFLLLFQDGFSCINPKGILYVPSSSSSSSSSSPQAFLPSFLNQNPGSATGWQGDWPPEVGGQYNGKSSINLACIRITTLCVYENKQKTKQIETRACWNTHHPERQHQK